MIDRARHLHSLRALLRQFPVVAIVGPRQIGKTTLARQLMASRRDETTVFDLESSEDLARLEEPLVHLRPLGGLVVVDEVQRRPDLFEAIRVLVDEPGAKRRFLVLGSASPTLLRQSSETWPVELLITSCRVSPSKRWASRPGQNCGAGGAFRARSSPAPRRRACAGGMS